MRQNSLAYKLKIFLNPAMKGLDLTRGNIFKNLFAVGVPIMLSSIIMSLFEITDSIFLGRFSSSAIASTQIGRMVIMLIMLVGIGISSGGATLIAQSRGAQSEESINKFAGQTLFLIMALSVFFSLFILLFSTPLLKLFNTPDLIFDDARIYMVTILGLTPIMYMMVGFQNIFSGVGNTFVPFLLILINVILNIFLDYFLIFGIAFIPPLGVFGAALATVISRLVLAIICGYILISGKWGIKIRLHDLKPDLEKIKMILKIGVPNAVGASGSSLGIIVLLVIVHSVSIDFFNGSPVIINAIGIQNVVIGIYLIAAIGLKQGVAVMVGQCIGGNKMKRAEKSVWQGVLIAAVFLLIGFFVTFFFADSLSQLFIPSHIQYSRETAVIVQKIFRYIAHSAVALGIMMVMTGAFQGSGYTMPIMLLDIGRIWIFRLPVAYFFAYSLQLADDGIWWSMLISNYLTAFIGILWFLKGSWKKRALIRLQQAQEKAQQNSQPLPEDSPV